MTGTGMSTFMLLTMIGHEGVDIYANTFLSWSKFLNADYSLMNAYTTTTITVKTTILTI